MKFATKRLDTFVIMMRDAVNKGGKITPSKRDEDGKRDVKVA